MAQHGVTEAYEIGTGKVLAGLVGRIDKSIKTASIGDPAGIGAALEALMS
jgi:[acyl-carrier-protein] S-malonyltransferase